MADNRKLRPVSENKYKTRGHGPMGAAKAAEKPKDLKGTLGKLYRYSKKNIPLVIFGVLLAIGGAALTLMGPNILSKMTDEIAEGIMTSIDLGFIYSLGITLCVIYLVSLLFNSSQRFIFATVAQKIS
ncbi:MAG TPA: hypothetical protein VJ916_06775, partial [Anaerovoracaceae bacterium]|nr:hypothetical protein [Anaerovoracaceae bacterium]